jgi:hypothetical protein
MDFLRIRLDHWLKWSLGRFIVNSLVVWTMLGSYMLINHHQSSSPTILLMPRWVPFYPAFVIAYLMMLLTTWLLPVAITEPARFRACLLANICAWLLVMPWWIIAPTMLPRPPLPDAPWGEAFRWTWMVDEPYNVMPCAHGIGPLVAAWFAAREHPRWRWPLAAMLAVGLSSIALIWQHRPFDILLGTLAAVMGIIVAETWKPQAKLRIGSVRPL